MKKDNKKPKKYLTGSKINTYVEDPSTAMAKNQIMLAQAAYEAATDPLVTGLGAASALIGTVGDSLLNYGGAFSGGSRKTRNNTTAPIKGNKAFLKTSNPFSNIGDFKAPAIKVATGGKLPLVPAEVEGGELLEFPNGEMFDVRGASHANGGVKGVFPEGTAVFSKKFGTKGKNGKFVSFADKKRLRENRLKRAEKNSEDFIGKNTKKRIEEANAVEEAMDMAMMQEAFMAYNNLSPNSLKAPTGGLLRKKETYQDWLDKEEWRMGGLLPEFEAYASSPSSTSKDTPLKMDPLRIDPLRLIPLRPTPLRGLENPHPLMSSDLRTLPADIQAEVSKDMFGPLVGNNSPLSKTAPVGKAGVYGSGKTSSPNGSPDDGGNNHSSGFFGFKPNMTIGDFIGFAGNAYRAYADRMGTLSENATDSPNPNYFANYGNEALDANRKSMEYIDGMMDRAKQDVEASTLAARRTGRNGATSINTMRAMDLALEANKNKAYLDIYDRYAQGMMSLLSQKAQLENDQDLKVMGGAREADISNRQDKAARNMASKLSKDNTGKFITSAGDFLNKGKLRRDTQGLLNSMSQYTDFDFITGKLVGKGGEAWEKAMLKDGSWKKHAFPNGQVATTEAEFKTLVSKFRKG